MEIGWNDNPSNGMRNLLTQGGSNNPGALAAGSTPSGTIDPMTGQPIYNPAGTPGATAITPPATDPVTGQPIYTPSGVPGATPITPPPGADPTKYYRPPAQTDPRFIHADQHWTPQQRAAYELAVNSGPAGHDAAAALGAADWADWDQRRAGYGVQEADARARWKASLNPAGGTGVDAPVYDPDTDTFSTVDKDGKWTYGVKASDIYSKLTDDVKKQYPEWYFGEYATQQEQNKRTNLDAAAYQNQSFARMGQQSTRYAATGL